MTLEHIFFFFWLESEAQEPDIGSSLLFDLDLKLKFEKTSLKRGLGSLIRVI